MTSYLLGVQTNIAMKRSTKPAQTTSQLLFAWTATITIFLIISPRVPVLMPYAGFLQKLSTGAVVVLVGTFLVFLGMSDTTFAKSFHVFVSIAFVVFLVLLFSNMVVIIQRCKYPGSVRCDAVNGATTLYIDMINMLQNAGIRMVGV